MNSAYKLLCLAAAFMASSSGFADQSMISQSSQSQNNSTTMKKSTKAPAFEQGMGLPANKYPAAYNAPASICLKNAWDFNLFGSFIYWHASQDAMDIAYIPPNVTASTTTTYGGSVAFQRVNYEPGFKVGFGFNTNHDGWVFRGEYTWAPSKHHYFCHYSTSFAFWCCGKLDCRRLVYVQSFVWNGKFWRRCFFFLENEPGYG